MDTFFEDPLFPLCGECMLNTLKCARKVTKLSKKEPNTEQVLYIATDYRGRQPKGERKERSVKLYKFAPSTEKVLICLL